MKGKKSKAVVRKGGLTRNLYLTRSCGWTREWNKAARFATQDAATAAAKRCGVGDDFGIFPTGPHPIPRRKARKARKAR
jgi:hypothetical protein